jgi:hypothetical protein
MKDLFNNLKVSRGLSPAAAGTDNTPYVSEILDMQGWKSALFALLCGALTDVDATFAVTVDESDAANMSGSNAVAAADLLGTTSGASFTFAADDTIRKIGYIGSKRYVRVTVTPSANSSAAVLSAVALQSHGDLLPEDTTDQTH